MNNAEKIMKSNKSVEEKTELMLKHWRSVEKWVDKNEKVQKKYTEDELLKLLRQILEFIVELNKMDIAEGVIK